MGFVIFLLFVIAVIFIVYYALPRKHRATFVQGMQALGTTNKINEQNDLLAKKHDVKKAAMMGMTGRKLD